MPIYKCSMGDPLDILVEECSEVIQAAMKYRRFGGSAVDQNPATGESARDQLVQEIGDVLALVEILVHHGDLSLTEAELVAAKEHKYGKLRDLFGFEPSYRGRNFP